MASLIRHPKCSFKNKCSRPLGITKETTTAYMVTTSCSSIFQLNTWICWSRRFNPMLRLFSYAMQSSINAIFRLILEGNKTDKVEIGLTTMLPSIVKTGDLLLLRLLLRLNLLRNLHDRYYTTLIKKKWNNFQRKESSVLKTFGRFVLNL